MPSRPQALLCLWLAVLTLAVLPLAALAAPPVSRSGVTASSPAYGAWHSCVIGGGGYLLDTLIGPSDPKRVYAHGDMDGWLDLRGMKARLGN